MLATVKHLLARKRIVLASSSPRRQQLIRSIGLDIELCPSNFEENLDYHDFKEFAEFVETTADGKAEEVYQRLHAADPTADLLVIGADTMVTMGEEVYGKPKDAADAVRMLTNLSGKCNRTHTGISLRHSKGRRHFTETTDVYFGVLTKEQIQDYVDSGEPLDKAGAYGIQGIGGSLIEKIEGDYYCVMGLPLHRLCKEICALLEDTQNDCPPEKKAREE
ncbi:dTTP/UTP pyrophosphatase [Zeugodacus cucurbitae]|uniref:N-acetylserotonin O-methyltransferase-like protein n=1 Tax=Zeugodacus cucurbitae TaxID=28588 RepID=A0A0A1WUM9_ZEUCU|nr:dTTP/UTP pyrophosphatase [Zeugodacus cucurbitae]